MNDNLPELRDIHLPEGISWWPPAYGWFVILAVIIGGYFLYKLIKLWRIKSRKLYALHILKTLDKKEIIESSIKISELLRRICVYMYPEAVSLEGEKWINFLKKSGKSKLSDKAADLLRNAPYVNPQKNNYNAIDLEDLSEFSRQWIGENL